jgi:SAM-dependent methyltransferase
VAFNRDARVAQWLVEAGLAPEYHWYLCERCGNAYQNVTSDPSVAVKFWENHSHEHDRSRRGAEVVYREFEQHLIGRSVLDIGCGLGYLVRKFAAAGWDAFGIDPTPSHKAVHESLGVRTEITQAEQFEPHRQFDAVFSCYAIYFVGDPVRFLERVKTWLSPNGQMCIVISDFLASTDAGLPSYAHSFYPTFGSMRFLLAKAGFRVKRSWRRRSSFYFVALPADDVELPKVNIGWTKVLYRTKRLRYLIVGKPLNAVVRIAAQLRRKR